MRINERIQGKEIRVIGAEGEQFGVLPPSEGLRMAREKQLDLVEVAPTASPPVCRIIDYSKYKYEQERKEKESRKRQKSFHMKEVKFRPKIEEHDYQVKLHQLEKFLKKGDKVKVTMTFRGREMAHPELGRRILDRLIQDSAGFAEVEKNPIPEGNIITMVFGHK
ncbi:MAG: translation initiation factor IF-3 [Candidatus Omnitrophica bacterium]|nr:translation initiation factor IF-3 [Candidatus Omnitrophota bacterium]